MAENKTEAGPIVTERVVTREVKEPPLGPHATTEPPEDHFFRTPDGRKVNAFGEEIGSDEAKRRKLAGG